MMQFYQADRSKSEFFNRLVDHTRLIGSSFVSWVKPDYLIQAMESMQRALLTDEVATFRCCVSHAEDGHGVPIWMTGQARQQEGRHYFDCMLLAVPE